MTSRAFLATARLSLRPLGPADEPAVVAGLGRWEVARWLGRVPFPYRAEDFRAFLPQATPGRVWAVEDGAGLAGCIGSQGELGYWLAPRAWGLGYATEAGRAVVAAHFDDPGSGPLRSSHHEGNAASRRVLLKLGFRPDGFRLVCPASRPEVPVLSARLTLTRAEWRAAG